MRPSQNYGTGVTLSNIRPPQAAYLNASIPNGKQSLNTGFPVQ